MTRPDPLDEALALVAEDRAKFLAHLAAADRDQAAPKHAKPYLVQPQGCNGWLRHWWRVEDETTGTVIAKGRALTEWGARRRKVRAYDRALNPRPAVETSWLASRWRTWAP